MYADFFFRAGGQEELGFRGFAQPKLQEKFNSVIASLIIGMMWFLWHLPLLLWLPTFEPVQSYEETLMFGIFVVELSFTYTWIYNRTQSILLPMLLHATYNTVQTFLSTNFSHPHPSGWLIAWFSLIIPYSVLGVWLVWRDKSGNNARALASE
jgi:membrane protease YdiL (CAAX protease family)